MVTKKVTKSRKPASNKPAAKKQEVRSMKASAAPTNGATKKVSSGNKKESSIEKKKTTTKSKALETTLAERGRQVELSQDEISARAWEIWQREGCPVGRDMEHWLQAERELLSAK